MPDEADHQRGWYDRDGELVTALVTGQRRQAQMLLARYLDDSEGQIIDTIRARAR